MTRISDEELLPSVREFVRVSGDLAYPCGIRAALVAFLENPPQSALNAAANGQTGMLRRELRVIAAALRDAP